MWQNFTALHRTVVMSARRKRYEEEGEFCIPGLGDRNYRPGELSGQTSWSSTQLRLRKQQDSDLVLPTGISKIDIWSGWAGLGISRTKS